MFLSGTFLLRFKRACLWKGFKAVHAGFFLVSNVTPGVTDFSLRKVDVLFRPSENEEFRKWRVLCWRCRFSNFSCTDAFLMYSNLLYLSGRITCLLWLWLFKKTRTGFQKDYKGYSLFGRGGVTSLASCSFKGEINTSSLEVSHDKWRCWVTPGFLWPPS